MIHCLKIWHTEHCTKRNVVFKKQKSLRVISGSSFNFICPVQFSVDLYYRVFTHRQKKPWKQVWYFRAMRWIMLYYINILIFLMLQLFYTIRGYLNVIGAILCTHAAIKTNLYVKHLFLRQTILVAHFMCEYLTYLYLYLSFFSCFNSSVTSTSMNRLFFYKKMCVAMPEQNNVECWM